jgi:hypothetical protein
LIAVNYAASHAFVIEARRSARRIIHEKRYRIRAGVISTSSRLDRERIVVAVINHLSRDDVRSAKINRYLFRALAERSDVRNFVAFYTWISQCRQRFSRSD